MLQKFIPDSSRPQDPHRVVIVRICFKTEIQLNIYSNYWLWWVFGEGPGYSQNQNRIPRVFQENSYHLTTEGFEGWRLTFNLQWMCFGPIADQEKWQVCVFHVSDYKATSKWPPFYSTSLTCFYLDRDLVLLQSSVKCFSFKCCRSGWSPRKSTKTREVKKQDFAWNVSVDGFGGNMNIYAINSQWCLNCEWLYKQGICSDVAAKQQNFLGIVAYVMFI